MTKQTPNFFVLFCFVLLCCVFSCVFVLFLFCSCCFCFRFVEFLRATRAASTAVVLIRFEVLVRVGSDGFVFSVSSGHRPVAMTGS